jgi:hypothetical protein
MNTLDLQETSSTPSIIYEGNDKLVIKGRSLPEDVVKFYQPVFEWANNLKVDTLIVEINLEYMNSASSKHLLNLLQLLDSNNGIQDLQINWYYEKGDEDALEDGQTFEEYLLKAHFTFHEYAEAA